MFLYMLLSVISSLVISSHPHTTPFQKCYIFNPLVINGTQNASQLLCPDQCKCQYCPRERDDYLKYTHNVYCIGLKLETMPTNDTLPTDMMYYYVKNNFITSIQNDYFMNAPDLEYLHLENNDLSFKDIELNAFRGLRKLKYLALNGNDKLGKLFAKWFEDMTSLQHLYASHCGLTTLETRLFEKCDDLQKVVLSHNSFTSIPANIFKNVPLLDYLSLDNNLLLILPDNMFSNSSKMKELILNDNVISSISEKVGLQHLTKLEILNVAYNKFSCDCKLVWFRNWLDATNVAIYDINKTKCYTNKHTKVYNRLMDFDPQNLHCSRLYKILEIAIPLASTAIFVTIIGLTIYALRYDIRYWNQKRLIRKQYQKLENQGPPPVNGDNIRYDAFVSYNNKDQDWVLKTLQPVLEDKMNYKICVDYRDFIAGEAIAINIANAVKYSRKVLVVISKNFAKSEWCYFELEMARMRMIDNHEDILIVVMLEKVSSRQMPLLLHKILREKTYIEWEEHPDGQALFLAKLEAALLTPNCHRERLLENV